MVPIQVLLSTNRATPADGLAPLAQTRAELEHRRKAEPGSAKKANS
jgi:hypothetical protein